MWRAIFLDGPLKGPENDMRMAGIWKERLYFVPAPERFARPWALVGFAPGLVPDPPWPGQLEYVRNDERSQLLKMENYGDDEGWAAYALG